MPTNMLNAFLVALLSALATTVVAVSAEWLKQRGQEARAKRDAGQRLDFLSAWLTLRERVTQLQSDADRVLIGRQLEHIWRKAEEAWSRERAQYPVQAAIKRLLILGVRGHNWLAKFLRVLYWIVLAWLMIFGIPGFVKRLQHTLMLIQSSPDRSQAYHAGLFVGGAGRGMAQHLILPIFLLLVLRWIIGALIRRSIESHLPSHP